MKTSLLSTVHDTTCMSKPPFALHEVSLAGKHAVIASTDLLTNLSNILLQRQVPSSPRPRPLLQLRPEDYQTSVWPVCG